MKRFGTFADFYPVYLAMHSHPTCRRLHVIGNVLGLAAAVAGVLAANVWLFVLAPVLVNGFAFVGHTVYQRNRPGVLKYPFYGMVGNWVMTRDVLIGRIAW